MLPNNVPYSHVRDRDIGADIDVRAALAITGAVREFEFNICISYRITHPTATYDMCTMRHHNRVAIFG